MERGSESFSDKKCFFLSLRVIVKKKLKKGPRLEELEERGEEEREGRHLLLMQGFPVYKHPTSLFLARYLPAAAMSHPWLQFPTKPSFLLLRPQRQHRVLRVQELLLSG